MQYEFNSYSEVVSCFLHQFLTKRSVDGVLSCVDDNVVISKLEFSNIITGKKQLREALINCFEIVPESFLYEIFFSREQTITENCTSIYCNVRVCCKNNIDDTYIVNMCATVVKKDGTYKISNIFAVGNESNNIPLSIYAETAIEQAKKELLKSSIAGGLMGCFYDEDYSILFVEDYIAKHFGYDSTEDFVNNINGKYIQSIHSDDVDIVRSIIKAQLLSNEEYEVRYRAKKRMVHIYGWLKEED